MVSRIFVNLPVNDIKKSIEFFSHLGFKFNLQFTSNDTTCMIVNEHIYVMLLAKERFKDFTKKDISDAKKTTEVLMALQVESREKVDEMVITAVASGGMVYSEKQDHGHMYGWSFEDLDGHQWEVFYMDEAAVQQ